MYSGANDLEPLNGMSLAGKVTALKKMIKDESNWTIKLEHEVLELQLLVENERGITNKKV